MKTIWQNLPPKHTRSQKNRHKDKMSALSSLCLFLSRTYGLFCSKLLPQSSNHSESADLLCKSLLPHVWAGSKSPNLIVQARTAFVTFNPCTHFFIFTNCVYLGNHTSSIVPIGPFLCLAMMTSAISFFSVSL